MEKLHAFFKEKNENMVKIRGVISTLIRLVDF